jgi:ABC-type sugar transport system ATPase subunit
MPDVDLERITTVFPDGTLALDDLSLHVDDGEIMTVVGSSGSGKSTLLRVIAGLDPVTRGRVMIGGRDVTDLDPPQRDVAMVFEHDALYPHMTADGNLRFGLEVRRTPKPEIDERVGTESRLLGLRSWLHRRPDTLSAGEKQRVAVGRASVRRPRLFLLDEPLCHLDAGERQRLRREFSAYLRSLDVTTIIVTHDQEQAMAIGDRVGIMTDGRIAQVGRPNELYLRPASTAVASSLGDPPMSLLPGWLEDDDGLWLVIGRLRLPFAGPATELVAGRLGEPIVVGIRPEHAGPAGGVRGHGGGVQVEVELPVASVEWRGRDQLVVCPVEQAGNVVARAPNHLRLRPGDRLRLVFDMSRLSLFDPVTGAAVWHGAAEPEPA